MAAKKKTYALQRRFYVDAIWEVAANSLEEAVQLLQQTKPSDILKVEGDVNDIDVVKGHDGVFEIA